MYQDWMENVPILGEIKQRCVYCYKEIKGYYKYCPYCGRRK